MAEKSSGTSVMWFIAGAAVGAAVALLYTPVPGEEVRRRIAEKTEEGRSALSDQGRDIIDRGRDMYERGRQLADEAAEMFERGRRLVEGAGQGQQPGGPQEA